MKDCESLQNGIKSFIWECNVMSNTVLLLDKQRYLGGTEISGLLPKSAGSSKSSDKKIAGNCIIDAELNDV